MFTRSKEKARTGRFRLPACLDIPPPDHLPHLWPHRIALERACLLTGRSARTLCRQAAAGFPDLACRSVLQTDVFGLLPHAAWQEWHLTPDGRLAHWMAAREPRPFTPAQLQAVALAYAHVSALRLEVERLRAQLEARPAALPPDLAANDPGRVPDQMRLVLMVRH